MDYFPVVPDIVRAASWSGDRSLSGRFTAVRHAVGISVHCMEENIYG
jgi:hypothetical protein